MIIIVGGLYLEKTICKHIITGKKKEPTQKQNKTFPFPGVYFMLTYLWFKAVYVYFPQRKISASFQVEKQKFLVF